MGGLGKSPNLPLADNRKTGNRFDTVKFRFRPAAEEGTTATLTTQTSRRERPALSTPIEAMARRLVALGTR